MRNESTRIFLKLIFKDLKENTNTWLKGDVESIMRSAGMKSIIAERKRLHKLIPHRYCRKKEGRGMLIH